ncbi:LVIVD repeat-containing protein [Ornithinimicrobium sp. W1679]|uniref:LVIVD repeat-containing protein n=1 Tax=Ornithinimicrobium sp. W1679 TaxID=3418770 RepID=UPI003CEDF479
MRLLRRRGARTATAALGALALTVGTAAGTAGASSVGLAPGESASSENVTHLANVPIPEVFQGSIGSDLAFQDDLAFIGSYGGFWVADISEPSAPQVITEVLCPGGQGDISVEGDLLFLSVDSPRSDDSCTSTGSSAADATSWEGVRVFDISDVTSPEYVAAVRTDCGSHTHTLVPSKNKKNVYVYVSSYGPRDTFPNCGQPHDSISIIDVPVADPSAAAVVAVPDLFADDGGGNPGENGSSRTSGCHDITAFPDRNIAAGACMGDGIMLDITHPTEPKVIERVRDTENFAFWHSATFNTKLDKVVFTDELGGGVGATCLDTIADTKGANAIYSLDARGNLAHQSYFKMPRTQTPQENCVAHNGSLIPVKGKDMMVQAWYQGGVSVWDFTDSSSPEEFGWFERGPIDPDDLVLGGAWSAYYYNGHIYASDITEGLDVLAIHDERTDPAAKVRMDTLNVQSQPRYVGRGN